MGKEIKTVPDTEILKYKGTPEKPDIKIFVSHRIDQDSETVDSTQFIPVRCGAVYDKRDNVDMLGDDTGENISERRGIFNELTVMYWAWKNVKADYYGLCHYRRYFSFGELKKQNVYTNIDCDYLTKENIEKFRLTDADHITKTVENYDVILTTPFDVTKAPEKSKNLFEQFDLSSVMHRKDLETALDLMKSMHPDYYEDAREYFEGTRFYPCLMFIMKKRLFFEFCDWLFPFLFALEKHLDNEHYSQEELRGLAHIGERLLGVFVAHLRKNEPDLRIKILQRVLFWHPVPIHPPLPIDKKNCIPVVFSTSDYFAPYMAITMYSTLKNASKNYYYDLIVLTTDLGKRMEENIRKMLQQFPNCSLRIFDITPYVQDRKSILNAHVPKETFYRLLTPELFCHYDRIVYLDSDLIVQRDISELYTLSMDENVVAAVRDCDIMGEYRQNTYFMQDLQSYCDEVLKLEDPYAYFQAGVMVFNITNMRKVFAAEELVEYVQTNFFIFADQDVLNVKCAGRVMYLPFNWNVMIDCGQFRIERFISKSPAEYYREYMKARKDPYIIHYAGFEKPWNSPLCDYSDVFWRYARETLFYEAIIFRMRDETFGSLQHAVNDLQGVTGVYDTRTNMRKRLEKVCPVGTRRRKAFERLIPWGSRRRQFFKKVYCFFSPASMPKV